MGKETLVTNSQESLLLLYAVDMGVNPGGDGGDMSPPPSEGCPFKKKYLKKSHSLLWKIYVCIPTII